jgi:hypothetical protein
MPYDLTSFSLTDVLRIGPTLRDAARDVDSMQTAATRIVDFLYRECVDGAGAKACALVRFYKTHPYDGLDRSLQRFAQRALGSEPPKPSMKCLTLLATTGDRSEWTSPRTSRQHQAIPLVSEKIVEQAPMISQLLKQFGMPVKDLIAPSPDVVMQELAEKTYNVFHVEHALGSPYIPAQEEFVKPYEIRSVLGFGGTLRTGDLFAVIMFSRAHIPESSATRFRTVALDVKASIFALDGNRVFSRNNPT